MKSPPSAISAYLKSPVKGTTLPQSPAKVSPAVRRNLVAMTTTTVRSSLISPSLSKWVSAASSKTGRSPRKLQVTPKKCTVANTPSHMTQSSEEQVMKERVKRKLCDDVITSSITVENGQLTPNKRHKCSDESARNTTLSVRSSHNKDSQPIVTPLKSDAQSCVRSREGSFAAHDDSARKALFPLSDGSHDVGLASRLLQPLSSPRSPSTSGALLPRFCGTNHQSPTQGLPNYVLNPEPRTPVGKLPPKLNKTPTWLTRLACDKSSPGQTNHSARILSPGLGDSKNFSSPVSTSGVEDKAVTPKVSGSRRRVDRGSRRKAAGNTPKLLGRRLQCVTPPRVATAGTQGSPQLDQVSRGQG